MKRVLKVKTKDALGREYSYYEIIRKYPEKDPEEKKPDEDKNEKDTIEPYPSNNFLND